MHNDIGRQRSARGGARSLPRSLAIGTSLALVTVLAGGCTSNRSQARTPTDSASVSSGASDSTSGDSTAGGASNSGAATTEATPPPTTAETTTTVARTTTTTIPPTTTTTIALVTEGAKVLVANATDVPGGAGRLTKELSGIGFTMDSATDAAGYEEFLDATKVYFLPAGEGVAASVAMVLGAPLVPMPTPAPITDATVGLGDATVLVMLGKDLAGSTPPGVAAR